MKLIVVSLFDGIGGALEALTKTHHQIFKYYYSEIDKGAIAIQKANNTSIEKVALGDIREIDISKLNDMIIQDKKECHNAKVLLVGGGVLVKTLVV